MGNWSELDYDLLGEIVLKLDAIQDFVYFSVVCRSWNRASSLVKPKWKPSMPCLLLILYEDASIGCLDLSDLSKSTKLEHSVKAKQFLPSSEVFENRLNKHLQEMYFVESLGKLLIVLRHKRDVWDPDSQVGEDEIYKTDRFEVFAFDTEARKWERVKELDDVALFVGDNQSISVKASDCRNCKSNCIYFTDDCDEFWDFPAKLGGDDMGFFDLEDGKIHQFYSGGDVHSDFFTPFWFMPHF